MVKQQTAKACQLKSKRVEEDSAWEHTIMLIVDEISFATKEEIETLNKNLRTIRDKQRGHFFGDIHVIFAEDFFQLKPVGSFKASLSLYRLQSLGKTSAYIYGVEDKL